MSNETIQQTSLRRRRRAFTLTEIAIVLGIVGLILGAIWAAAAAVYSNLKASQAQQGITYAAQQVRSLFAGSNNTGQAAGTVITTPGMFPVSWQSTTIGIVGNPWAQNPTANMSYVYAANSAAAVAGAGFVIELDGISDDGCASLIGFYNNKASTANGGNIAGLMGNKVTVTAGGNVAGTAAGAGTVTAGTYINPTACIGGTPKGVGGGNDAIDIGFDLSQM